MRELQLYVKALESALENVNYDINECALDDPEQVESESRRAVAMVSDAFEMIREAQRIIVRQFPT